ncbi:hypothetical protein [Kitasatospora kifunensis]|uniref:Uncharacterized protein n=1 Tax=Kitasatospora kifunensis TaxID=58351 RepID=A0A7W7RA69_KITKI|nr:hypothetical protein [Kitasatospora kifunensis]MBB4928285.1 hypothetical protein [Kitasatospora kifunensis]
MSAATLPGFQPLLDTTHQALLLSPYLGAAALAAAGVWAAVVRRRIRSARAALANRTSVEVVPTTGFDPSEGEVGRFSHHLARVRQAAGDIPARGAAVRLRYSADGGRMRCLLEGPARAAAILNLPGFAEVEVRSTRPGQGIEPVRFTTATGATR